MYCKINRDIRRASVIIPSKIVNKIKYKNYMNFRYLVMSSESLEGSDAKNLTLK